MFLLTISIIGIFTARNAFAANSNQALTPDNTKITVTVQEDKQSALALCGKQVFTLKLTPIPFTTYSLLTEWNGEWKEEDVTINSIDVLGYEEPKIDNENISYLGSDQQEHTVTATAKTNYLWKETIYNDTNKTYTATFDWEYYVQYAVCIYDIDKEDGQGPQTITFGPATGSSYDNTIKNATLITDDWAIIKKNADEGKAHEKYNTALHNGNIKIIDIKLNESIANTTSWPSSLNVCSMLYGSIKSDYLKWNYKYEGHTLENPASRCDTSRIRATLNGKNTTGPSTNDYANWNTCLTTDKCLFSCLPSDLQSVIKEKTIKVPIEWSISYPYTINEDKTVEVKDKLWIANANELWKEPEVMFNDYGECFYKYEHKLDVEKVAYDENKSGKWRWLRCPGRFHRYYSSIVHDEGYPGASTVDKANIGLAPCFCIGTVTPANVTLDLGEGKLNQRCFCSVWLNTSWKRK